MADESGRADMGGVTVLAMSEETLIRLYAHHHPDFTKTAATAIGRRPAVARNGA